MCVIILVNAPTNSGFYLYQTGLSLIPHKIWWTKRKWCCAVLNTIKSKLLSLRSSLPGEGEVYARGNRLLYLYLAVWNYLAWQMGNRLGVFSPFLPTAFVHRGSRRLASVPLLPLCAKQQSIKTLPSFSDPLKCNTHCHGPLFYCVKQFNHLAVLYMTNGTPYGKNMF